MDSTVSSDIRNEHGHPFSIVTNSRGRRIIIINRPVNVGKVNELDDEDFDAIYINITHNSYEENRLLMRWLSPMRVDKCFLKPRFATSSLEDVMRFATYLIDGFCASPLDDVFTDFIEEVYGNIEKFNISRELTNDLSTTSRILANIVKFDISRGRLTYTNCMIKGLAQGYPLVYLSWYDNQETLHFEERVKFHMKLEELGFAEKSRFIERVHVCPNCGDSHLLFMECCPKCRRSDITQEQMIHHFRCANISPESAYAYDGQLVCPKCKHVLRHIGVDYDRPATIYTCGGCGNTFMQSAMKVLCTNCKSEMSPEELNPIDVWEYKYTRAGLAAFATDDALFQIESNDIYSGRSTYDNLIESIRVFNNLLSYQNSSLFVFRYTYTYDGDYENWQIFDVMRSVISAITTVKIATRDSDFFILAVVGNDRAAAQHDRVKKHLDQLFSDYSADSDDFSARWLKTYKLMHGDDSEAFISQLGENIVSQIEGTEVISDSDGKGNSDDNNDNNGKESKGSFSIWSF